MLNRIGLTLSFFLSLSLYTKLDSLKSEIEDAQKLAESRLVEIDQLSQQIINLKQDLEKAKLANQQVN